MGNLFYRNRCKHDIIPLVHIDKSSDFHIPPLNNVEIRYNKDSFFIYHKNKRIFEVSWKRVLRWSLIDYSVFCLVFSIDKDLTSNIVFYTKKGHYLEYLNKQFLLITNSTPLIE